jgi:hypothetical protein
MTLTQAIAELKTAVADSKTTKEQLNELMGIVRTAREKAKKEMAGAEGELRLILTPDQEAVLIGMGYMD